MVIVKQQTMGYDGLISHVGSGVHVAVTNNELNEDVDQNLDQEFLRLDSLESGEESEDF